MNPIHSIRAHGYKAATGVKSKATLNHRTPFNSDALKRYLQCFCARTHNAPLELLTHARNRYGESGLNVLCAAWRAGKGQDMAPKTQEGTSDGNSSLILAPHLQRPESNCGSPIRRSIRPTGRRNGSRYGSVATPFKLRSSSAGEVNKMKMQLE
jgi:hypothetical protein